MTALVQKIEDTEILNVFPASWLGKPDILEAVDLWDKGRDFKLTPCGKALVSIKDAKELKAKGFRLVRVLVNGDEWLVNL